MGATPDRLGQPAAVKRFGLHRDTDLTGVSGTRPVAEGVEFSDGTVVLHWRTEWPTSVVFHDRDIAAMDRSTGHRGANRIVDLD
jgi:hypothetical protein